MFVNCSSTDNPGVDIYKEELTPSCYEVVGEIPELIFIDDIFFGKIFVETSFNFDTKKFENYIIKRSHTKLKSDSSHHSNYDSDGNEELLNPYRNIILEFKNRIDSSGFGLVKTLEENCENNTSFTLPLEVK